MEGIVVLDYNPDDLESISRMVQSNSSFVALITGDLYNLPFYLFPSELSGFTAILDRNVYTRITGLVRGMSFSSGGGVDYRWAAAVLAFCQIAGIMFQYESSLQEYASHKGGESAMDDYECFYRADNCDPKAWIDFALGRRPGVDLSSVSDLPPLDAAPEPSKFERPIYEFRANYIFALKIANLSLDASPPFQLMMKFIEWMDEEFLLGAAAFVFANLLFSPDRLRGMLKKRTLKDVRNIAWDFALIQHWKKCAFKGHSLKTPVMLVTGDKVVKYIAERIVASDFEEYKSFVVGPWKNNPSKGDAIFERYLRLNEKIQNDPGRRPLPSDAELDALTAELENQLLGKR